MKQDIGRSLDHVPREELRTEIHRLEERVCVLEEILAKIVGEALWGDVMDVTTREAIRILAHHEA